MAYVKNIWVDQDVERPKTYEVTNNQDGSITLTDSFGLVTELGTPVNAVNMNHIEDGIYDNDTHIGDLTQLSTTVKTDLVSAINEVSNGSFANQNLSNLSTSGENRLHALKGYLDNGTLLTDGQGLADLKSMAHTTFDVSKFTVTGSPTITADGIASGFSSSNYITIPDLDVTGKDFEFDFGKITTPSTINNINTFIAGTTLGKRFIVAISNESKFYVSSGGSNFSTIFRNTAVTTNTDYYLKAGITGSSVYLKVSTDGTNWDTTTGSVTTAYTELQAELVGGGSSIAPYTGQLNLKDFVVRIGGAPVFSGNQTGSQTYTIGGASVTIPYTITKQGISIVDSYYRTQVTALANQEGWAPFFTLSDTDFTLPVGCLYGQFVNRNTPHIVAKYVNGNSWYRVWSNGWIEQGGQVVRNASDIQITLLIPYTAHYTIYSQQIGSSGGGYEYNNSQWLSYNDVYSFTIHTLYGTEINWRAEGY